MADRPQVNGWNNINLNEPEEYSSEFVIDGKRYANVTNVTTGDNYILCNQYLMLEDYSQQQILMEQ